MTFGLMMNGEGIRYLRGCCPRYVTPHALLPSGVVYSTMSVTCGSSWYLPLHRMSSSMMCHELKVGTSVPQKLAECVDRGVERVTGRLQ